MRRTYEHNEQVYCERHAPEGCEGAITVGVGSVDAPQNCCVCSAPCNYSLTGDGVKYVIRAIEAQMQVRDNWVIAHPHQDVKDWYHLSPSYAVVRDWAFELKDNYGLEAEQGEVVLAFLEAIQEFESTFEE